MKPALVFKTQAPRLRFVNFNKEYKSTFASASTLQHASSIHSPSTKNTLKPNKMATAQNNGGAVQDKKKSNPAKPANEKATRSVNSFMMFRSYYASIFETIQQKVISAYIVVLWESDPFKAKWAILAKAYSVIRDRVGKAHAPLDAFLMLVADFVKIIAPKDYLVAMGWAVSFDHLGNVSLVKSDQAKIDHGKLSTNVSMEDIIKFACERKYAAMGSINNGSVSQPSMAMAASAQSLPVGTANTNGSVSQPSMTMAATAQSLPVGTANTNPQASPPTVGQVQNTITVPPPVHPYIGDTEDLIIYRVRGLGDSGPVIPGTTMGLIENPSFIDNITDWDPNRASSIFQPYEGCAFDAFDMSQWVHPDIPQE
ncbi:MAG: hypothetical protein L6R40_008701 [Gallowayella cf. fulva]|nr:MAG: hypothetical protein L6R40_008701 [Xanthomendoza cf. fulva]